LENNRNGGAGNIEAAASDRIGQKPFTARPARYRTGRWIRGMDDAEAAAKLDLARVPLDEVRRRLGL
jgi:hypothetical protein